MKIQKYSVNQHLIETILAWVNSGEIAIPEIQRPFVWDATKVRDLMDSLYQGYPLPDRLAQSECKTEGRFNFGRQENPD